MNIKEANDSIYELDVIHKVLNVISNNFNITVSKLQSVDTLIAKSSEIVVDIDDMLEGLNLVKKMVLCMKEKSYES